MSRFLAREIAFKALFQLDFNSGGDEDKEIFENLAINAAIHINEDSEDEEEYEEIATDTILANSSNELSESNFNYINKSVKAARSKLNEIDEIISAHLKKGWIIQRLATVDRNILRLAVYEIKFAEELIPKGIVINEAVEIAKRYGTENSGRFVNGILAAIAN